MVIVSELLGHSNMKITQDYYGKIIRKKVSQEYNKLQLRINPRERVRRIRQRRRRRRRETFRFREAKSKIQRS